MCKIALEALQEIRLNTAGHWSSENEAIEKAKKKQKKFEPYVLTNGDTKQLLAKSLFPIQKQIKVV
jgi:hypothetical protein